MWPALSECGTKRFWRKSATLRRLAQPHPEIADHFGSCVFNCCVLSFSQMITVTDKAAGELRALLERKGATPESGLRLAVRKGGCAGWQYVMEIAAPEEGDTIVEVPGARVIVAADSAGKLQGCRIDYCDDLNDAGFRIDNPNAARSCGCGTSFETAHEPTPEPEECR